MNAMKGHRASLGNWKLTVEKRSKLVEFEILKKKAGELQNELASIIQAISRTEDQFEKAKKEDDKAWLEVVRVKAEQQKTLNELVTTIKELEVRLPILKREKEEAEEASRTEKMELVKLEDALREKEIELEKLKEIFSVKKQDLEDIRMEQKNIERQHHTQLQKMMTEESERRQKNLLSYEEECKERMDMYAEQMRDLRELLSQLSDERQLLQDTIGKYTERLPLLEEKNMLLLTELQCQANAEVDLETDSVDLCGGNI